MKQCFRNVTLPFKYYWHRLLFEISRLSAICICLDQHAKLRCTSTLRISDKELFHRRHTRIGIHIRPPDKCFLKHFNHFPLYFPFFCISHAMGIPSVVFSFAVVIRFRQITKKWISTCENRYRLL